MYELRGYIDEKGNRRFAKWFEGLNASVAAKVTMALTRIECGNHSHVKGVGAGILEYKMDFGPGYRIYFGKDGERLVILIGGGMKKRQDKDIAAAQGVGRLQTEENSCPLPMTSRKPFGRVRSAIKNFDRHSCVRPWKAT